MKRKGSTTCKPCKKKAYATFQIVAQVAIRCTQRSDRSIRYYRCPKGMGWHITSKPQRKRTRL